MKQQTAYNNMTKQQLKAGGVLETSILNLFDGIAREDFVPEPLKSIAYSDTQIQLAHGQRMMTPLEEGLLLQALSIQKHETVLEIGTGSGFLTALLSKLGKQVISVDYYQDFTKNAQKKLSQHNCDNVTLITGDASNGWVDKAPFDVVIFTATLEQVSETHKLQVVPGGRLFALVGNEVISRGMLYSFDHEQKWNSSFVFETNLPAIIDPLKPKKFVF